MAVATVIMAARALCILPLQPWEWQQGRQGQEARVRISLASTLTSW